jgi:hypothetical protein
VDDDELWKGKAIRALLLLHIILLPASMLLWGKGYIALARHLHEGILYEITSILSPYRWHLDRWEDLVTGGSNPPLFWTKTDLLSVPVSDPAELGFPGLDIIWGERLEEDFRYLQPPDALDSLVWVEGVERTGNREPTLIAYGTTELEGEWQSTEIIGGPTYHGMAVLSQRVYNLDCLWLIFYTTRDLAGKPVMPYDVPVIRKTRYGHWIAPIGSPGERWIPKGLTSMEILERISTYRPGVMPIGYRLRVLSAMPGETWFWIPRGFNETLFLIIYTGLAVATTPHRILFYLPLVLAPRILVWPVAIFWAMLWIAGWSWSIACYRRLRS